jgi:hypothetical protein
MQFFLPNNQNLIINTGGCKKNKKIKPQKRELCVHSNLPIPLRGDICLLLYISGLSQAHEKEYYKIDKKVSGFFGSISWLNTST